jgi:hypothetical protein
VEGELLLCIAESEMGESYGNGMAVGIHVYNLYLGSIVMKTENLLTSTIRREQMVCEVSR